MTPNPAFDRTERLVGADAMQALQQARVLIVGVGGVGSWCAESLLRTGVGHLTLVDADTVCHTNLNRQLMATTSTLGRPKVDALRERLLDICPTADVVARREVFTADTAARFALDDYDYVVDAIDSLHDKAELLLRASAAHTTLFSSMGAALKMDPTRVQVAEFWKVKGCPLAAALRRRFKRLKVFPARKFRCVFSDELLPNLGGCIEHDAPQVHQVLTAQPEAVGLPRKAQVNGSLMHITALFGLTLSGLIVQHICRQAQQA